MGAPALRTSYRSIASVAFAATLVALATRAVPTDWAVGAALRLLAGAFLVAILPGISLLLLCRPERRTSVTDFLALGIAANFAWIQLLTILAVWAHLPARTVFLATTFGAISILAWTILRKGSTSVATWPHQLAFLGLLVLPAGVAYVLGSPYTYAAGEDGTHIAVIRRLALLQAPAIDNLYWAPGIVYTYPFPATHYLLALVSQASDLDPMFVYRKIRFLWVFCAQLFLFAAARRLFGSEKVALLTGVAGVAFSLSGPFALVHSFEGNVFSWSQLIPLSHAADVAMNVYLPGLLFVTLWLLETRNRGHQALLALISAGLILLLAVVHVRESVQFFVYVGALSAGSLLLREWSTFRRSLAIFGGGLAVTLGYLAWHRGAVGHIDTFVRERRETLVRVAADFNPADWLARPFLHPAFGSSLDSFFFSWFPLLLLIGPALLAWRPRRPQVLFLFFSVSAYLLIVRFAVLTIPYIYLTYFEILFTPVRNVVFFAYLMTGFGVALAAGRISAVSPGWHRGLALAAAAAGGALWYWTAGPLLARWPARWLDFALLLHATALWLVIRNWKHVSLPLMRASRGRPWVTTGGVLIVLIASFTFSVRSSPLAGAGSLTIATPRQALLLPVIEERDVAFPYDPSHPERLGQHASIRIQRILSTPPPPALIAWAGRSLSTEDVFAVNLLNRYSPAPFLPQQIAYWPHIDLSTGSYFRRIFPAYYQHLETSLTLRATQPFFNPEESLPERLRFLRDVGATHVLVDPMYHAGLVGLLASWPESFEKLYDAESWAVFKVVRSP